MGGSHPLLPLQNEQSHHELSDDQDRCQQSDDHEKGFHRRAVSFKIELPGVGQWLSRTDCDAGDSVRRQFLAACVGTASEGRSGMNLERIQQNLEDMRGRIAAAAVRSGRLPTAVRLIAVTKLSPLEWIRPLVACGQLDLGENYPQELWRKSESLADLGNRTRWHLIGHLQSNKVKKTLPLVTMVHSVDSLKLLSAINENAADRAGAPDLCLQVNTSGEASKHGWSPAEVIADAEAIAECRAVPIVGLMTMAALGSTADAARESFRMLREVRDALARKSGLALPELSMGMSSDFEAAILEGATLVRVGSALFEGVEP
jgi:PLP dependent protein